LQQVCVQLHAAAVNTSLLALAAERRAVVQIWIGRRARLLQTRRAAIDRYRPPAGPTAANPPRAAAAANGRIYQFSYIKRTTDIHKTYILLII